MKSLLFKLLLLFLVFNLYKCKSIKKNINKNDTNLHCKQYDFETKLNITVGNNITVIYNSASCKKCLQKLIIFRALQNRFELASYNELTFIMLTTEHQGTPQFNEFQNKAGNIQIISLHDIMNEFFIPKSFYIFDKCSRLTYELTSQFSEVQNQVVKAAILSTWFDSPCGGCTLDGSDSAFYTDDNYITYEEIDEIRQPNDNANVEQQNSNAELFKNIDSTMIHLDYHDIVENTNDNNPEDNSYIIPLKIIIPSEHIHLNNSSDKLKKYNYFILNSNDSAYHEHLLHDNTENLYLSTNTNKSNENNSTEMENIENNSTFVDIKLINDEGLNYEITKNYNILDKDEMIKVSEYQEIKPVKSVTILTLATDEASGKEFRNAKDSSIYTALYPWLSFRLRLGTS